MSAELTVARQPFIDGKFVPGTEPFGVVNPATEEVFTEVEAASPAQFELPLEDHLQPAAGQLLRLGRAVTPPRQEEAGR